MKFKEYVAQFVTIDNAVEYSQVNDKLAFVSDLIGLSVDHRFTNAIEDRLDRITSTKVGAIPANFFFAP